MAQLLKRLWNDQEGAAAAEYALILGLCALGIIVGAGLLGTAMNGHLTTSSTRITATLPAP